MAVADKGRRRRVTVARRREVSDQELFEASEMKAVESVTLVSETRAAYNSAVASLSGTKSRRQYRYRNCQDYRGSKRIQDTRINIIKHVDSAGADVNQSVGGSTGLQDAVQANNKELVDLFVKSGADLHATRLSHDPYIIRETPLFVALRHGHLDIVKTLVEGGARLDFLCKLEKTWQYNVTAFNASLLCNNLQITAYCIQNSVDTRPRFSMISYKNLECPDVYREILESVVFIFLEHENFSVIFVKSVLSLLVELGFKLYSDPYCLWLIQKGREWVLKGNVPALNTDKEFFTDRDILLHVLTEYSSDGFQSSYLQPLFDSMGYMALKSSARRNEKLEAVKSLTEESYNVGTLASLCRIKIRKRLSLVNRCRALKLSVQKLALPPLLIRYLMLDDKDANPPEDSEFRENSGYLGIL